jgi:lambda family phage portal protein
MNKNKPTLNFIDRAVSFFSPSAGLDRARARFQMNLIRNYEGASKAPRNKNWNAKSTSANTEIQTALTTLRDRSRELTRNNAYWSKAIEVIANKVVGSGIRPRIDEDSIGKAEKKRILKLWKQFSETTECDFDGNLTFYGLQRLIARAKTESGEVLIRRRRVAKGSLLPIQYQLVEGDLLDHLKSISTSEGNYIVQGIEFDSRGKKVAYWVYDRHPNETLGFFIKMPQSQRIPIDDIIQVYEVMRPGQLRGTPDGTSGMNAFRDFDDYEDAQLMRQKIAACFSVFVHDNTESLANAAAGVDIDEEEDGTLSERVQPGMIEELPPGKTISFASPPGTEGYGEYSKNVLRKGAASFNLTYESLTGDLSNVNYTSFKAGQITESLRIENLQNNVMIPVCNKLWKWFVDGAILAGKIGRNAEGVTVSWTPPKKQQVDPVKEIKGLSEEVRNGFTSWSEAVSSLGWNPEDLIFELSKDQELFDKFKMMLACDPRFDVARPVPNHASLMLTGSATPPAPDAAAPVTES